MGFKIEESGEISKKLQRFQQAVEDLSGEHEYAFAELFPPTFMLQYTGHKSIERFFGDSGFSVASPGEFKAIPEDELDLYVERSTSFSSWEEMQAKAVQELVIRKLDI
jgi:hypothetical protein